MVDIASYPLKERKRARVRLSLADSMTRRTRERSFEKIRVEQLCEDAEVSRATFFRFFPKKIDLIFFAMNLWTIETGWHLENRYKSASGYRRIAAFFHLSANSFEKHRHFFIAAIGQRVLDPVEFNREDNEFNRVSVLERFIRFPDYKGIESIPEGGFTRILRECIGIAIHNNELPKNTDGEKAVLSLACLFYGIPVMVSDRSAKNLTLVYSRQLDTIWQGLGGKTEPHDSL